MMNVELLITAVVAAVLGGGLAFVLSRVKSPPVAPAGEAEQELRRELSRVESEWSRLRDDMERRIDAEVNFRLKDKVLEERSKLEIALDKEREEILNLEKRLLAREETMETKLGQLERREERMEERAQRLESDRQRMTQWEEKLKTDEAALSHKLEEMAGLSREEARELVMEMMREEARHAAAHHVRQIEQEAREDAEKRSREIITTAIQRMAGEFVSERTVSVVPLPSDDLKGRIIGREGRNIRAIEAATGVDLIVDDTPEAVVISGFNPVRRAVAKKALELLIEDGRIHPQRIEEMVKKAEKEVAREIKEAGEQAILEVGIGSVHPDLVRILGALKYRTSYTQNVLSHSVEVAFFAGMMADELGLDPKIARRAGLLHDVGKAIDHDREGSHAMIGGDLGRKYKERPEVINAIEGHHFDVEAISPYTPLVHAADALSAAHPGARREMMETYIKRLRDLEAIASNFTGVERSYAIQAGRELRVIVCQDKVDDQGTLTLANAIARKIEDELTYPGEIKVTVIRETRVQQTAH